MSESKWHQYVRKEYVKKLKMRFSDVFSSHSGYTDLDLFRGESCRENHFSNADIIVLNDKEKVIKIIEIESVLNPKKIFGIVLATHFSTICRVKKVGDIKTKKHNYPIKDIELKIVYKKPKDKAKDTEKIKIIKELADNLIDLSTGCVRELTIKEYI